VIGKDFMRLLTKGVCAIVVFGILCFIACEESLPPRDLKDFLSPVFQAVDTTDVFTVTGQDTVPSGASVSFFVGVKNGSDELLQAKANIHGTIEISSSTDPAFHRTLQFALPEYDEVAVDPMGEFAVQVRWDQRDDSCHYVFRNLEFDTVRLGSEFLSHLYWRTTSALTFQARGTVQFWPNVRTMELEEVTFRKRFYLPFKPEDSFLNSRECK
jgi:hypothetical protein